MPKPVTSNAGSVPVNKAKTEAVPQPKPPPPVAAAPKPVKKTGNFKAVAPKGPDVTKSAEFKKLDPAVQKQITEGLKPVTDPAAKKNVGDVVTSPAFGKLPAKTQGEVVKALMKDPANPEYTNDLKALINNGGPHKDLCIGSKGPAVKELQEKLKAAGHDPGKIDGDFGADTAKALKAYQKEKGLKTDGIAGAETVGELQQKRFTGLSEQSQGELLGKLSNHPTDPAARETIEKTALSPGFRQLDQKDQTKLLNLIGGSNKDIAPAARRGANELVADPAFAKLTPEKQKEALKKYVDDPKLRGVVAPQVGAFDGKREKYTVTGPVDTKDFAFRGGKADAKTYEVEIDGKKIPVHMPANPDKALEYHSIEEVAKSLAALPKSSRALVKEVNVEQVKNPDDEKIWRKKYNDPNFNSYMTAGAAGTISIYPSDKGSKNSQSYMDGTMIHETGHTLSTQKWGELGETRADDDKRWDKWKAAAASDGVAPSEYAKNSPGEDFGEALQLYQQVKGTPQEEEIRQLMPERYKIIKELLGE